MCSVNTQEAGCIYVRKYTSVCGVIIGHVVISLTSFPLTPSLVIDMV